ncbi:MAG: hypothetical protein ACFFG0_00410 [Candidatus Thorarchaeota archaeon]
MSEKFIQLRIPCKECLVQAACKDKIGDQIKLSKHKNSCLVLPDWNINEKPYQKVFLSVGQILDGI